MRTRGFWEQASAEVDAGEPIAVVAKRHGVRPRTLSWWRWKLESEARPTPRFLPVVVGTRSEPIPPVEILVAGVSLRVAVGTDVEYVASITAALRRNRPIIDAGGAR